MKSTLIAATAVLSTASAMPHLMKRDSGDKISSCGSTWMAGVDVSTNNGEIPRRGYVSAVDAFCQAADGQIVGASSYLSMATRVFINDGGDPASNGDNGYVYFEIHNQQKTGDHKVDASDCKTYLQQLSSSNSSCFGDEHHDTKGGTWQIGSDVASYHALANPVLPAQDAVDKLYTDGPLSALTGSNGAALTPFPTNFTSDVTPVPVHSHNDYTRDVPLYDALSTGCMSFEADVWLHGENLRVAHTDPGDSGPTIQDLYINPLKALLDAQNPNGGNSKGLYPTNSSQTAVLLVDFKSEGNSTWDAVIKALQPLKDAGYLSNYDGTKFVQGPITVVASGNAPLAKAKDDTANPGHALFMDARINESMDGFDTTNTYYTSADFTSAVTSSSTSPMSADNLKKVQDQVSAAHAKGFLVRYCKLLAPWRKELR